MILRGLRWVRRELHVRRDPVGYARKIGVQVGQDCWLIATSVSTWGTEPYLIALGDGVTITSGVRFVTHDGSILLFRHEHPDIDLMGPIIIGSNSFIGLNTILLPGTSIGEESIVGAGSVVRGEFSPRSVIAGSPARVVGTVDEYWQKNQSRFLHIHRMPPDEKRKLLMTHFGLDRS